MFSASKDSKGGGTANHVASSLTISAAAQQLPKAAPRASAGPGSGFSGLVKEAPSRAMPGTMPGTMPGSQGNKISAAVDQEVDEEEDEEDYQRWLAAAVKSGGALATSEGQEEDDRTETKEKKLW